ncbi:MAG: acyltransferase [Mariprofundaceae bacterium]
MLRILRYFQGVYWRRKSVFMHPTSTLESGVGLSCHNAGELHIGAGAVLKEQVKIACNGGCICLGERVQVGYFSVIASHGSIQVGADTLIAEHVSIRGSQHRFDQGAVPKLMQGYSVEPIVIGINVWIGAKVVILPGVEIGDHAVIGAGAVVTHSIPAGKLAVGIPAKVIADVPNL